MKFFLCLALFPFVIFSQENPNIEKLDSKKLYFSSDLGVKLYTSNLLLGQQSFSREGVYINFNIFSKKEINPSTFFIAKSNLILSNAVSKKIQVFSSYPELDTAFYFSTKIPNILSCNINLIFELNKKINYFFSHSAVLKFRVYSLFYKKGNIFGSEINSLGGLLSSEENGSLPGLEKASTLEYAFKCSYNTSIISFLIFLNSDWNINSFNDFTLYPGFGINFEKFFTFNK